MTQHNYRVIAIEGYEMVGKSTFIENYFPTAMSYRPSYEDLNLSKYIPGNSRSLLGVSVLDFILQNPEAMISDLVLDRGLLTGILYADLYPGNGKSPREDIEKFVDIYRKLNASIIYLKHTDRDYAYEMFNRSQSRKTNDSSFDPATFEEYWSSYEMIYAKSKLILDDLKIRGIDYVEIDTVSATDRHYVDSLLSSSNYI